MYFWPNAGSNEYITQMQKAIIQSGCITYKGKLRDAIFCCDVIHFNWFEAISGETIRSKLRYLKKRLTMFLLRMFRKKTVFTFHNKMPHDNNAKTPVSRSMLRYMLRHSDAVVIHCMESIPFIKSILPDADTAKIHYVPHPNYIAVYNATENYSSYAKNHDTILLTFIGLLRPYKCAEILIKAARELRNFHDVHFLICGKGEEAYTAELMKMTEGTSNITADFRFIDDGEIPSLLEMSDALILPYNTTSELNSGASYLAFSFGRTIIGTHTGTTRDIDDQSLIYCYDYTDDEAEHVSRLKDAIMKFCDDFRNDSNSIKHKGEKLKEMMTEKHSIEQVAKRLQEVYGTS